MNRHPKELVDVWIGDLVDAFERSAAQYERPLDRGGPREQAVRDAFRAFLPRKYGVATGHVVSSHPAWSRQTDVFVYNVLETPVFAHDDGHQGTVVPAEGVYGVFEVKSTLDEKAFTDALQKIAEFKKLCEKVDEPPLGDRFGAVFAYALPHAEPDAQRRLFDIYIEAASALPERYQPDEIFVLGTRSQPGRYYATRVHQESPRGPLGYTLTSDPDKAFRIFLLSVYNRLTWIRTGAPLNIVNYLFDPRIETSSERLDDRYRREAGLASVGEAVTASLNALLSRPPTCPMCSGHQFSAYDDTYCLIATKDLHFGKLNAPRIVVAAVECTRCGFLSLHPSDKLGVTLPLSHAE